MGTLSLTLRKIGRTVALAACILTAVPAAAGAATATAMDPATASAGTATTATAAGAGLQAQVRAAPGLMPAKVRECGWGIKTRYHSCDLARNLTYEYLYSGFPAYLEYVYSPNSGNYYDFWCSGSKKVTCKSEFGTVYITVRSVPQFRACGSDVYGQQLVAWGSASCALAFNAADAYWNQMQTMIQVTHPVTGRSLWMQCYSSQPVICFANKSWVFIR
jgi:hypothetical protein